MKNVTISDLRAAIDTFEHFFDEEPNVPAIGKIEVDNHFRVNIHADNGKWYKYDPLYKTITEHSNDWRH